MNETEAIKKAARLAYEEAIDAAKTYHEFNSAHEGYAVILEELDELKAEVFKKPNHINEKALQKEALQVAAMGIRFAADICLKKRAG